MAKQGTLWRQAAKGCCSHFWGIRYIVGMGDTEPKSRWFHLTPDRLILGLLVVECLLWLSERFHWFAFNQRKGWTVLVAVASVGITLVSMLVWFAIALFFHLRFQFGLRLLLVLVVVVAIPCSWLAVGECRRQGGSTTP